MSTCIILGAGSHARETYFQIRSTAGLSFKRFAFVDDYLEHTELELEGTRWPILKDWDFTRYRTGSDDARFVVGVGSPVLKQKLVERALESGLSPLPTLIHPSVIQTDPSNHIGVGGLIAPGCILTTNIRIGDFAILNVGVSIAHDVTLGDYVTVAPRVALGGHTTIGASCYLGIGCVTREKVSIAERVTVGAQAAVVADWHTPGSTLVGVPARVLEAADG